jgi:hypothetical protein
MQLVRSWQRLRRTRYEVRIAKLPCLIENPYESPALARERLETMRSSFQKEQCFEQLASVLGSF